MKKLTVVTVVSILISALIFSCSLLGVRKLPLISISPPAPQVNITPRVTVSPGVSPGFTTQYMLQMYQVAFSYTFGIGGYWIWASDFTPGHWTKWEVTTAEGDKITTEMAYLKLTPDGNEWWRVSYYPQKEDEEPLIYEGMFSSDLGQLKRLRAKFGNKEPQEIPVTEGTYVAKPVRPTKESIEGAKRGIETVTVPAGTYSAERIRYGSVSGGTIEWWTNKQVAGGIVKYLITDEDKQLVIQSQLLSFGSGANSILGSF